MRRFYFLFFVVMLISACVPQRDYIYFYKKNKAKITDSLHTDVQVQAMPRHYIKPGDVLDIFITSDVSLDLSSVQKKDATSDNQQGGYMVPTTGYVNLPLIGQVKVVDHTSDDLHDTISRRLLKYYNAPFVKVTVQSFNVSVIGEVLFPGMKRVSGDHVTILQALSMAGDLSLDGKRTEIKIIREESGKVKMIPIDIASATVFNSEAYYLQSNDVIVVSPYKYKRYLSKSQQVIYLTNLVNTILIVASFFRTP